MSSNSPELNAALSRRLASLERLTAWQISHFFRLSKHLSLYTPSVIGPHVVEYNSPWLKLSSNNEQSTFLATMARFSCRPFRPRVAELYVPRTEPPYLGCRRCIAKFDPSANQITKLLPKIDEADQTTGYFPNLEHVILPESDAWNDLYTNLNRLEDITVATIIGQMVIQRHQLFVNPCAL